MPVHEVPASVADLDQQPVRVREQPRESASGVVSDGLLPPDHGVRLGAGARDQLDETRARSQELQIVIVPRHDESHTFLLQHTDQCRAVPHLTRGLEVLGVMDQPAPDGGEGAKGWDSDDLLTELRDDYDPEIPVTTLGSEGRKEDSAAFILDWNPWKIRRLN